METNETKSAPKSRSKRSTNGNSATSRASSGAAATRPAKKAARRGKRKKTAAQRSAAAQAAELSPEQRAKRIAVAAYYLAEQRAFAPNHELDDWLTAERSL